MSEPTVIEAEATLEERVESLEGLVARLQEAHKSVLEQFREMIVAVTEISGVSFEE
jgi:chaperonin cofactor prefoldin